MKLEEQWAEMFTLLFLILGFMIAILLKSPFFSYLSIILAGFVAGRIYFLKHASEPIFPFILIIAGFLVGYLIAGIWVNRVLTLIFFTIGFSTSYYLHLKQILVTFKSKNFVK